MKNITYILLLFLCVLSVTGCYRTKQKIYYQDKDNYINVSGTVIVIGIYDEKEIVFELSEIDKDLDGPNFKIIGDLAYEGINDNCFGLSEGQDVTVTIAPRYFGDGYAYPVVGLKINNDEKITFEDGYNNLLEWLS